MHLAGTIQLLHQWGRWGRLRAPGQLPSMSPMFGERALKTPLYTQEAPPPEIVLIDTAVERIGLLQREIVMLRYQRRATYRSMARFMNINVRYVGEMLSHAENAVHRQVEHLTVLNNKGI